MIGFGTLTPYAGWALTQHPLTGAGAWALAGFAPLFAALYPLTQLYQLDEDRARGDRTLAIALGVRASLAVAMLSAAVAFACFARASSFASLPRYGGAGFVALCVAGVAWLAVLVPWITRAPRDVAGVAQARDVRGAWSPGRSQISRYFLPWLRRSTRLASSTARIAGCARACAVKPARHDRVTCSFWLT